MKRWELGHENRKILEMKKIKIKIMKLVEGAKIPSYAHDGDAGMDVFSCEDKIIRPGKRELISTGISAELPNGYVALVWDKSGIATKNGVTKIAGVIDSGYRGEWKIALINLGEEDFKIEKGQKIAQVIIQEVISPEIVETLELEDSERSERGFGSTGLK